MSTDKPRILLITRCLIKNEKNEILFVKRSTDSSWAPNKWEFPGGQIDEGQNVTEAAEREVYEETALHVKITSPICYYESHTAQGKKYRGIPLILLIEPAELVGGQVKLSNEHQDYIWLLKKDALDLDITSDTREALISLLK